MSEYTKPLPWVKFYSKDFIASTMGWSAEEVGAYMLALMHQHCNEKIPNAESLLKKILRIEDEYTVDNDRLVQELADKGVSYKSICNFLLWAEKQSNDRIEEVVMERYEIEVPYKKVQSNRWQKIWDKIKSKFIEVKEGLVNKRLRHELFIGKKDQFIKSLNGCINRRLGVLYKKYNIQGDEKEQTGLMVRGFMEDKKEALILGAKDKATMNKEARSLVDQLFAEITGKDPVKDQKELQVVEIETKKEDGLVISSAEQLQDYVGDSDSVNQEAKMVMNHYLSLNVNYLPPNHWPSIRIIQERLDKGADHPEGASVDEMIGIIDTKYSDMINGRFGLTKEHFYPETLFGEKKFYKYKTHYKDQSNGRRYDTNEQMVGEYRVHVAAQSDIRI